MKTFLQRLKVLVTKHKIIASIVAIAIVSIVYWSYGKFTSTSGETRYVTAQAEKATIITSVTGTGQVTVSNQVDLKAKNSGDVVMVSAKNGDTLSVGDLIVKLDTTELAKAVRDAEVNVESAQLSLEKLQKPADTLSITQSENTLSRARESKVNAGDDLKKAYEDGFNTTANVFLDLPTMMTGLHDVLFNSSNGLGNGQWNIDYYAASAAIYDDRATLYKADAISKYNTARDAYESAYTAYKATSRGAGTADIESVINTTYEATKKIADAVKSATNVIQFYEDRLTEHGLKPATVADTHLTSLSNYTGKTNTHLLNLLNTKNTIKSDTDAIVNADRTIVENTQALAKLKAGTEPLDIESSQLSLKQRQNALLDAQEKLADAYVRAPFDGTVAKISVIKGDSVASGASVATFITTQQLAQISLNEVDVAKIRTGDKVTVTFDAVEGLEITGVVSDIDSLGTVTQGVVTYGVKIIFDTQDERVKPGMSVSASIITAVKSDALTVPNSAVKTKGSQTYVEVFNPALPPTTDATGAVSSVLPTQKNVQVGLSNDSLTEIVSGLKEGEQVVTRTVTATTKTTTAPNILSAAGVRTNGGGVRATTGR